MKNDLNNGALASNFGESDYDNMGEVDMFGLDEFGQPAGGDSMWGAVIGGGVGTGVAMIARAMTKPTSKVHQYSELAGLLAGSIAGGVMMAFPGTRRMGWAAAATALVTNGLRQLENSVFNPYAMTLAEAQAMVAAAAAAPDQKATPEKAAAYAGAGFGGVTINPTGVIQPYQGNGFGIATIEPGFVVPANLPAMQNNGFGGVTIDPAFPVPGSISGGGAGFGADRPDLMGPPTLVGAGDYGMSNDPGAAQVRTLGGPGISAMGAHFGATLFGGGN
jgi:hypothetical protein